MSVCGEFLSTAWVMALAFLAPGGGGNVCAVPTRRTAGLLHLTPPRSPPRQARLYLGGSFAKHFSQEGPLSRMRAAQ